MRDFRFGHSLGVAHLAAKWTEKLAVNCAREKGELYSFDNADVALAAAAGTHRSGSSALRVLSEPCCCSMSSMYALDLGAGCEMCVRFRVFVLRRVVS